MTKLLFSVSWGSKRLGNRYQNLNRVLINKMIEVVNRCQIQEWYVKFKSISVKTQIHKLPESFVQYLLDDSGPFLLPASVTNEDVLPKRIHNPGEEEDYQVSEKV